MKRLLLLLLPALLSLASLRAEDFPLIHPEEPLNIYYGPDLSPVVYTAIEMFAGDLQSVSGKIPVKTDAPRDRTLVVGTAGTPATESFAEQFGVDLSDLWQQWEAYKIMQVNDDRSGSLLLVIGSDPRGTAYGVLELSRLIGVSPWVWWADVTPEPLREFHLDSGFVKTGSPSVAYRGIFLNDEDWGLMPWSSMTLEAGGEPGRIGPETYSRIFGLLLRLRANTIWPAMHEKTVPFFRVGGNKEAADRYGIVIGSSHCEPLLCNSAGEWDESKKGDYNFLTNRDSVVRFWEDRLKSVGPQNNGFLTIGMRGIHDGRMQGVKNNREYKEALQQVIHTQRELIAQHIDPDPSAVPQAFIPYKEVLDVYDMGLEIPQDVTLVWCDDNYGYLTRLSDENERTRRGGAGVYYHISYWGRPHDYLWLCSTPPAQIYSEMKKAWDYGARKLWIVNVGDIKPAEYDTEFFLDMAWNIDSVTASTVSLHMEKWYGRTFGAEHARELTSVMSEYYRLAAERKPEHMGWSQVEVSGAPRGRTPVVDTQYNPLVFGDEIRERIDRYESLQNRVHKVYDPMPARLKDAYFQLVYYPVTAAAEMNKKLLFAQKSRLYASLYEEDSVGYAALGMAARHYAERSEEAYRTIERLTEEYNQRIAGGKWNRMMDMRPRELYVFNPAETPSVPENIPVSQPVVWAEGDSSPALPGADTLYLPAIVKEAGNSVFIKIFSDGIRPGYDRIVLPHWLRYTVHSGAAANETVILLEAEAVAWSPEQEDGIVSIFSAGEEFHFRLPVRRAGVSAAGYEVQQAVGWNACDHTEESGAQLIEGYGHSGRAVSLLPATDSLRHSLRFEVFTASVGDAKIKVFVIPTHPVNGGEMRVAFSVNGGPVAEKSFQTVFRSEPWKENVLRGQAVLEFDHEFTEPGIQTIELFALDENIVIDQLMVDFDPGRSHYRVPVAK